MGNDSSKRYEVDRSGYDKLLKTYSERIAVDKIVNGQYVTSSPNSTALHRHTYYQIVWIRRGEGTHLIEGINHHFREGDVFLLAPHYLHKISYQPNVKGFVVSFSDTILDSFQNKSTLLFHDIDQCLVKVPEKEIKLLHTEFKLLYRYLGQTSSRTNLAIISNYLHIILSKIDAFKYPIRNKNKEADQLSFKLLEQYDALVRRHFKEEKQLSFYVEQLAVSQRKLSDVIKGITGLTPAKYLERYILNEAARMLQYSTFSVKEIGAELGYNDNSYFTKTFKKQFHLTPVEFRTRAKENNPDK
ncbi:hypothetical protein GCM10028791_32270 [Echinicola sediminis]